MEKKDALLEDFLNGQSVEIEHERIQLIRILSRLGTLPKIANIKVNYIHSQPEMFLIDPGKQLRVGIRLLQKPILALVALRFGIEWQIWYQAVKEADGDSRVADLAASLVAIKFMDLLPDDDRSELIRNMPEDLNELHTLLRSSDFKVEDYYKVNSFEIAKFHKLPMPQGPIKQEWLEIIKTWAVPTEALMMSGGDIRLNIETKTLLNVYGCRPFPRTEAYSFASSTATSVSNRAFEQTQRAREVLIHDSFKKGLKESYRDHRQELLGRLKNLLKLGSETDVITAPSGTDISLLFAGMCQALYGQNVTHILVASDETGSGVPMALEGRHFADTSALNVPVTKESKIEGFGQSQVVKIPLRDSAGVLKSAESLDQEVERALLQAIENGKKPVLHVMDQSKLGYASPSAAFLDVLNVKFQNRVVVLVDNSQLRMNPARIHQYLKQSYFITITGSKFYTGPPFSGALAIPKAYSQAIKTCVESLPVGLKEYFQKIEFLENIPMSRSLAKGFNPGSYLRWYAARVEISRYYQVPFVLRKMGSEMFCEHVQKKIASANYLEPLEMNPSKHSLPLPVEPRTIFPFFIIQNGQVLSHLQADRLYRLLNRDVSALANFEPDEERIARQVCHIGQPVKVLYRNQIPSAVVRISMGARIISESWRDKDVSLYFQRIENQLNQVDIVCRKIKLVLKYADVLMAD